MGDQRDTVNVRTPFCGPRPTRERNVVCCIGDTHGLIAKLRRLWSNLEALIPPPDFQTALVIFLGDYCDRGPDTKQVIDFLVSLPSKYPHQSHVFLAGNHDYAFAAFAGLLPPPPRGSPFSDTWKEFEKSEVREGWFTGEGYQGMHVQGRRWAGVSAERFDDKGTEFMGSVYDAAPTFNSYGVPHGSADLVKALPEEHKKFLANLAWVHEEDDVCIETTEGVKHCKLIAVHAGLETKKDVQEQLKILRGKDTGIAKLPNLSGRKDVWDIPEELRATPTIVVSGHHGKLHIEGLRLIIDEGGGLQNNPVAAIVLPSMKVVRDTDNRLN